MLSLWGLASSWKEPQVSLAPFLSPSTAPGTWEAQSMLAGLNEVACLKFLV